MPPLGDGNVLGGLGTVSPPGEGKVLGGMGMVPSIGEGMSGGVGS